MRKRDLLLTFGLLVLVVSTLSVRADDYTVCKSTYALCTTARCTPVPGEEGTVSCGCSVKTGYSAGHHACQPVADTQEGKQVVSRYYPVKSLSICSNDRVWADCLDKPCTVDKNDPSKATCFCSTTKGKGPYVVVGDSYTPQTCTTGIVSSATVKGNQEINAFLKSSGKLDPFPVKVLNETSQGQMRPTGGKLDE
jgi:hypothetical protein